MIVGLLTLAAGIGMPSTQTVTGSTEVPENCVDTGMGNECFGGGTIDSRTTVDNPTKGPTIVSGLGLSLLGFILLLTSGKSDENDNNANGEVNGELLINKYPSEQTQRAEQESYTMNPDGGSTVRDESQTDVVGGRAQQQKQSSPQQQHRQQQQRPPQSESHQSQQHDQQPPQHGVPQQSSVVTFVEKYNDEIKYYGSIVGGIIVVHFLVSFLFGPTFLTNGFIGRIVTLLSWIGGAIAGLRFHEYRYQEGGQFQESP